MKKQWMITLLAMLTMQEVNAQNLVKIRECVIVNGALKNVDVDYNPVNGDKTVLVNGATTKFEKAYADKKDYAEGATWYINNEMINVNGNNYVKYGLPRVLGVLEITKSTVYKGIGVYIESGLTGTPEVIYIPVRQGCEFQPYQIKLPECGKVVIKSSVKEVKVGKNVTLTATVTGAKGTLSYSWGGYSTTYKGPVDKKSAVVSAANATVGSTIEATLYITGQGCETTVSHFIKVVK